MKKKELKGKFVVVYDTMVDGNQCIMDGEEGESDYTPSLFDTEEDAFIVIFDGNLAMLTSHQEEGMLEEYNEGVTPEMVEEMKKLYASGNVSGMKKFMEEHPECNDSGEWVEKADEFILGRKTIFTSKGLIIEGTKLYNK